MSHLWRRGFVINDLAETNRGREGGELTDELNQANSRSERELHQTRLPTGFSLSCNENGGGGPSERPDWIITPKAVFLFKQHAAPAQTRVGSICAKARHN